MKKTVYICNRCGKEIQTQGTRIFLSFFETEAGKSMEGVTVPDDEVHFCLDCTRQISQEILGLQKTGEEPPEENAGKEEQDEA